MQVPFEKIDTLRPTKCQDIHKVNFSNKIDYNKAKHILSMVNVRWSGNDFTYTIYFCGRRFEWGVIKEQ